MLLLDRLRGLFGHRVSPSADVRADAALLVIRHGKLAYFEARRLARAERNGHLAQEGPTRQHWDAVRQEIKRVEGRL